MTTALPAPGLAQTFALIMDGLNRAIAARMVRHPSAPLLLLIYSRLCRLAKRFAALATKVRAGTIRPRRQRGAAPRPDQKPRQRWPSGFASLVKLVPEAASFGSQLQALLATPEMAALLKTAPQAASILRPLCKMLAVQPAPGLLPPPPARPARPARPAPQRAAPAKPPPPHPPDPPNLVWRRWRGILMPEIARKPGSS